MLTHDQIKELIELVASHRMTGLEIERSGFRLTIDGYRHQEAASPAATPATPAPAPAAPAVAPAAVSAQAPAAPAAPVAAEPAADGPPAGSHVVTSPIVGTYYAAPNPDAEDFVSVGQTVKKGQVLCIVEAMKLMNEIECDFDGEILEIYPKNAQPVEYGEPLYAIMPR